MTVQFKNFLTQINALQPVFSGFKRKNSQISAQIKDTFEKSVKPAPEVGVARGAISALTTKLPISEVEKLLSETLKSLKNACLPKDKDIIYENLIDDFNKIKSHVNEKNVVLEGADTQETKDFCGDFLHEISNMTNIPRMLLLRSLKKNNPKPLQNNFHEICESEFNSIVDAFKKYQFFIDEKIYSPDFPVKKLLDFSLDLIKGKANSVSVEGAELLEQVKPDIKNTDFYSILSNTLQNAAKYSKNKGDIKVKFELAKNADNRDILNFSVEDNGIGIPKDQIPMVIKGVRASNTGEILGTGYGLNRVNKILQHAGSKIQIESEVGKGTKITCPIPCSNVN